MRYLLMFRSLTYAQRGARLLERSGITATITRVPRSAAVRGCSYGVLVSPAQSERAMELLSSGGLLPERIYMRNTDGSLRETGHDLA